MKRKQSVGKNGQISKSPLVLNIIQKNQNNKKAMNNCHSVFLMVFIITICGSWVVISWITSDPFGLDKNLVYLPEKLSSSGISSTVFFLLSLPTHFSV